MMIRVGLKADLLCQLPGPVLGLNNLSLGLSHLFGQALCPKALCHKDLSLMVLSSLVLFPLWHVRPPHHSHQSYRLLLSLLINLGDMLSRTSLSRTVRWVLITQTLMSIVLLNPLIKMSLSSLLGILAVKGLVPLPVRGEGL